MYYHLEKHTGVAWISTATLLRGEFRKRLEIINTLQTKTGREHRAKAITIEMALTLVKNGFKVVTKMEEYGE
jgi:hypothetical protein